MHEKSGDVKPLLAFADPLDIINIKVNRASKESDHLK